MSVAEKKQELLVTNLENALLEAKVEVLDKIIELNHLEQIKDVGQQLAALAVANRSMDERMICIA